MNARTALAVESVRVIRVFLASPSDLAEERRAAKTAITEINRTVARPAGFHVDLIGWEDTLSSVGRPQAIINEDLITCQMFIGMLWSRWGTAPDLDGHFTSGFEEEFHLALERNKIEQEPHMILFFKEIDPTKLSDPGPELSRVMKFKADIIEKKKILFDTFSNTAYFSEKLRIHVADFINKLNKTSKNLNDESHSKQGPADITSSSVEQQTSSSDDIIEADFLDSISSNLKDGKLNELDSIEIARMRNISFAFSRSDNDQSVLQAHDANLIYAQRATLQLSAREVNALADAGLESFNSENVPIWSWISKRLQEIPLWLVYSTIIGPDPRRIGAFKILTALRSPIYPDDRLTEERLGELWFSDSTSDSVRIAALDYVGVAGLVFFTRFAEAEIKRSDYATRRQALEAVIRLLSRESVRKAAQFAVGTSFDEIGRELLDLIIDGFEELSDTELFKALDHRSGDLRAKAIGILSHRKLLKHEQVRRFFGDASLATRHAAVLAAEVAGLTLSLEAVKDALVLKTPKNNLLLGGSSFDFAGNSAFDAIKRERLSKLSQKELERAFETEPFSTEEHYFALIEGHNKAYLDRARKDFDDRFIKFWEIMIKKILQQYGPGETSDTLISMMNEHQAFRRRQMMRLCLNILEKKSAKNDLPRIRRALDEDVVDPAVSDIDFFKKYGAHEDIRRVAKIAGDYRANIGYGLLNSSAPLAQASTAILKLANGKFSEILESDFSDALLAKIIASMKLSEFRQLGKLKIDHLLRHSSDQVRKASSLKLLISVDTKQAKFVLNSYINKDEFRYYNVIFWFDLCEAFAKDNYKAVARRELDRI